MQGPQNDTRLQSLPLHGECSSRGRQERTRSPRCMLFLCVTFLFSVSFPRTTVARGELGVCQPCSQATTAPATCCAGISRWWRGTLTRCLVNAVLVSRHRGRGALPSRALSPDYRTSHINRSLYGVRSCFLFFSAPLCLSFRP